MSDPETRGRVTRILIRASHGNRDALDSLLPLVYDELKVLSRARLRRESAGHTLNATALVHEAYLSLVEQERVQWQSRAHFFAVASLAMKRILMDHARARLSGKRGGSREHVALDDAAATPHTLFSRGEAEDLLALDVALGNLRTFNPQGADVVEYRFFGGLGHREIAEVIGVSEVTVRRRWTAARAWLRSKLDPETLHRTVTRLTAAAS